MKINKLLIIPVLLILLSCNRESPILNSRPSGVLSKEKMIDLLVDINLAESALRVGLPAHNLPSDSIYQKSQFIKVFEKNEVKPDDFDKSLNYYTEHVEDLNEIYLEVINKLSMMEAGLEAKNAPKVKAVAPKK
jgi:hypothetical protein